MTSMLMNNGREGVCNFANFVTISVGLSLIMRVFKLFIKSWFICIFLLFKCPNISRGKVLEVESIIENISEASSFYNDLQYQQSNLLQTKRLRIVRQAPPSPDERRPPQGQGVGQPTEQLQTTGLPIDIDSHRGTICEQRCNCQDNQMSCKQGGFSRIPDIPWPPGIEAVSFEDNDFTSLKSYSFNGQKYQSLRLIVFSFNRIKKIKANTFSGLTNLVEIRLESNEISTLESGAFNGLKNVELINLSNNKLKKINVDSFSSMKSLRELQLDENLLQNIPAGFFDEVPQLQSVSVAGNLWKCDCKILPLFLWVGPRRKIEGRPRCFDPGNLKGKEMLSFSFKEAHDMCDTPDDEDEDEDSDSDTLDTEKELKKINETCQEHSSSNMVDICYISKDVDTIPGERICIYCVGTKEDEEEKELQGNQEDNFNDLRISWEFSDSLNFSHFDRFIEHKNGTLCISDIEAGDSGEYKCTVKWRNFTETDSLMISVSSLTIQIAIGIAIGVVASFFAVLGMIFRWWFVEANAMETSRVVPTDMNKY